MTAEQYTDHQDNAARVYRWCGRAVLLLGSVGFTFAAMHSMQSQPWMGWTFGIVAAVLISILLITIVLGKTQDI